MHPQRSRQTAGRAPPGDRACVTAVTAVFDADVGGVEEIGVLLPAHADDQVRLVQKIAQVIVEPARPRVGPVQDVTDGAIAVLGFAVELPDLFELPLKPEAIVEREPGRCRGYASGRRSAAYRGTR